MSTILFEGRPATPGQALRQARYRAGLRQVDISDDLNTTVTSVSNWERDKGNVTLRNFIAALNRCGFVVSVRKRVAP